MRFIEVTLFLWLVLLAATVPAETVRTAIPRATVNYLSLPVADVKGFFRSEGLDNETIVIPGTTAIAALVSGNVDYSGAGGSGMRAAVRGAPIKAIMFQTEKVTWYLQGTPDILRISDLKGKRIAVGTIGDTQDTLITMLVEREGLTARDVTRVAMPSRSTMSTILALKDGGRQRRRGERRGIVARRKRRASHPRICWRSFSVSLSRVSGYRQNDRRAP
jgi:ABC-type nitrate/sulfonate/bicarbonate transport system substrate-binding protein